MNASDLRAVRQIALTIASATSALLEILEDATPAEVGAGDAGVPKEPIPEKLRNAGVPMFGRKPVDEIQAAAAAASSVGSGAADSPATD